MKQKRNAICIVLTLLLLLSLPFPFAFAETETAEQPIIILHTNDIHSRADGDLGYASVKGWKTYYESLGNPVLLLDAGDSLHGLPVANLSGGENIVELMNAVGYTAMTPGNHDFNYGTKRLIELSKLMEFDLLSANFTDSSGEPVFTASKLYQAGSRTVGIVGISTPETLTKTDPRNVSGYEFNPAKMAALVQAEIDALKADGADYVVALGHLGIDASSEPYRSTDLIPQLSGLTVFVDGHSHSALEKGQTVKDKDGNDVLLAQTGTQAEALGMVTIDGDTVTASLITEPKEDPSIKALLEEKNAEIAPTLAEVVASTDVPLDGNRDPGVRTKETNLGDLAADALRYVSGADIALTNGGGIRTSLAAGEVTYGDMNAVFPFGNTVVTIEITGTDLLAALQNGTAYAPAAAGSFAQVSGMSYEVLTYLAKDRVQNVMIGNEPLDLAKTYTLATNDFLYAGGDSYTMFANYPKSGEFGALDEALIAYVAEGLGGSVGSDYKDAQGRITVTLPPFADINAHWAASSITEVTEEGLFAGVTETTFQPDEPMTRAMFVTVLAKLDAAELTGYTESPFSDVDINSWYGVSAAWAAKNGIVSGIDEGLFAPNEAVTREQIAVMLTNYCKYKGTGPQGAWAILLDYTDLNAISEWAGEGVMFSTMKAYMSGYPDGSFRPQKTATRAEVASVMAQFSEVQAE